MSKNQPQTPLVTSVSSKLKKTVRQNDTQVVSPEEVKEKKRNLLGIIDDSIEVFCKNLKKGKVSLNSSADLERLVKLTLLLSGEADSVTGKPYGEQEQETSITAQSISMSKIEEILNLDDPEVKSMYEKISQGYNKLNDVDD